MKNILLVSAISSVLILSACSSDDAAQIIADEFVNVSGQITNISDVAESGVAIEGVYTDPGGLLDPTTTSDANGNFTLSVIKGDSFYLRSTKSTFATVNTARTTLSVAETGVELGIPTTVEAQGVIDAALGASTTPIVNKAWLVVDVADATGTELNAVAISSIPGPIVVVYTKCDGTDSGGNVTADAPCIPDRSGPMYIAYFDTAVEASVTVGSETQTAPVRMGEITVLEFEQ